MKWVYFAKHPSSALYWPVGFCLEAFIAARRELPARSSLHPQSPKKAQPKRRDEGSTENIKHTGIRGRWGAEQKRQAEQQQEESSEGANREPKIHRPRTLHRNGILPNRNGILPNGLWPIDEDRRFHSNFDFFRFGSHLACSMLPRPCCR